MNDEGKIEHYDSSDNSWDWARVDTHKRRYEYCEDYEDSIYCEVDPEGDAFTDPTLCDGQTCVASHCSSYWADSNADDRCHNESMTFDGSEVWYPRCTVTASCRNDDGTLFYSTGNEAPYRMDEMEYCGDGEITYKWC